MRLQRLLRLEWDAIAGVIAAVAALVLELFHVVEPGVLSAIVLALLALILVRDLRREPRHSELVARLSEQERGYRMRAGR